MAFPWYTDIYVDAAATGTGSGDTPANACVKVANNSLFTTTGSATIRAWVRRTHLESVDNTSNLGGNNMFDANKSQRHFIIGWPSSGDPFYDERPAAGITASWDIDTSVRSIYQLYGLNFPTLTTSLAFGAKMWCGLNIANFNFNLVASNAIGAHPFATCNSGVYMDNVVFTNRDGPTSRLDFTQFHGRIGRCWFINTGGSCFVVQSSTMEEFMIHSWSIVASGAIDNINGGSFNFRRVVNYSNSVDFLIHPGARMPTNEGTVFLQTIESVAGVKPYSGYLGVIGPYPQNISALYGYVRIDDWYGEGPVSTSGLFGPHMRLCSSAEAMYASNRAMIIECASWGGGNALYGANAEEMRPVRKYFDVTSGAAITIYQPVYVSSTGVFSLANGTGLAWLKALGCSPVHVTGSHTLAGSLASWSGSKLGGGAAYHIATTFTPQNTGRALYELTIPTIIQNAQLGITAYAMYGEPWSV